MSFNRLLIAKKLNLLNLNDDRDLTKIHLFMTFSKL